MALTKCTKDIIEALRDETIIAAFATIFDTKLKILTDRMNDILAENVALKIEMREHKAELKAAGLKIVAREA